jgi:hypothetical protein
MYPGRVEDILRISAQDIAKTWLGGVRRAANLKRCAQVSDEELVKMNQEFYPTLAGWFDGQTDRNKLGGFFVKIGKNGFKNSFPVSELMYMLLLSQKAALDFLLYQNPPETAIDFYRNTELTTAVTEFFMLGSFYLSKGFLESAYLGMTKDAGMSEDLVKKFLKDDFFFKDDR